MLMQMVILMTNNSRKEQEHSRYFERHNVWVSARSLTSDRETIRDWLQEPGCAAVLREESKLYTESGTVATSGYQGPALHICRLNAYKSALDGSVTCDTYVATVEGLLRIPLPSHDPPDDLFWDTYFVPAGGTLSLEELSALGLRVSAREQVLSRFAQDFIWFKERRTLRWHNSPSTRIVDFDFSVAEFVRGNHYLNYDQLRHRRLDRLLCHSINNGIHFRSSACRRERNYWLPGLNGGIPYTPKRDALHEVTYLFHDLMHYLIPDLVFDAVVGEAHRRTYITCRLLSEALTLVLADMLFVDALREGGVQYDFSRRAIYPVFQEGTWASVADVMWAVSEFALLGDFAALESHGVPSEPLARFKSKYTNFFAADFAWTGRNWANMLHRQDTVRRWMKLMTPEWLASLGLWTVSSAVDRIGSPEARSVPELVRRAFEAILRDRLSVAAADERPIMQGLSVSNAFRRYMTGQMAIFARYEPVTGLPIVAREILDSIQSSSILEVSRIRGIRALYEDHLKYLHNHFLISFEEYDLYREVFPIFDPFFLTKYENQTYYGSVAEANRAELRWA